MPQLHVHRHTCSELLPYLSSLGFPPAFFVIHLLDQGKWYFESGELLWQILKSEAGVMGAPGLQPVSQRLGIRNGRNIGALSP